MKPNKLTKKLWPPIHEITYTSGKVRWQVACMVNGQRIRETFDTRAKAETRAAQIRAQLQREGAAAFNLPPDVRAEAAKCLEKLKPYNATITEAVNYYVEHVLAYRNAPPVSEIINRLLADAKAAGRRDRTIYDLKVRLGKFARTFGNRQLAGISLEELQAWLDDPKLSPRSRIHNATKISQLYNYAIRHQWVDRNLAENITRPMPEDSEPSIFTVEEAAHLLEHADKFNLLGYIALGLFAGLRSAELQRLDWQAVKLSERSIIIGAEVAKRRSRRVVEIGDTLAAWLALCAKPKGAVVETRRLRKSLLALAKAAGIAKWPHNGLRHSFASYHLALHGDATKTAFQMGNSPIIVHNHYKGLVTSGDAQRFWSLRPAAAEDKIVAIAGPG